MASGNLRAYREDFTNRLMIMIAATTAVTVPLSILRARFTGWLPLYTLHAVLAIVVLSTVLTRNRLSADAKAGIFIAAFLVAGALGMVTFAFTTGAMFFFMFAIMLAAMLWRPLATAALSAGILGFGILVAWLFTTQRLVCMVDLNAYIAQPGAWISAFVFMVPFTGMLVLTINNYQRSLTLSHQTLEQRVAERTSALEAAHRQLQDFTIRLDRSVEEERQRISREVHDQLGPVFTGLRMNLLMHGAGLSPEFRAQADALLDSGITVARRIASELRPPLLDDLGLALALRHLAESSVKGAATRLVVDIEDDVQLGMHQANQLFAIAREALTNIGRHAQASQIRLDGVRDGNEYRLLIENDGRPYDESQVRADALGIVGMRERAALAGGTLTVQAGREGGATVIVRIPLPPEEAKAS